MQKANNRKESLLIILLILIISATVFYKLDQFKLIPGDFGDARFNNYLLENFYQFLIGHSTSLWNLNFYYPYPYIIGFSDNLFGSAPIYSLFRFFSFESDTSYQLWFLSGYVLNFVISYYCFKRLNLGHCASLVGALIFSFGLPTSSHAPHAQLHYRFAAALSITYTLLFIKEKNIIFFNWALFWLVAQFYCGIYIGFFTAILLGFIYLISILIDQNLSLFRSFNNLFIYNKVKFLLSMILLMSLLSLLFYPYILVQNLYGFERNWSEITLMMPRIQSYLISDQSPFWSFVSRALPAVPMRHEHQMFIGVFSGLLFVGGVSLGLRRKNNKPFLVVLGSFISCVIISISINGFSIWYLFHELPLFSAIRAVTRIDQILLFPIGYISAQAIIYFRDKKLLKISITLIFSILIFCEWAITPYAWDSKKDDWRQRIILTNSLIPDKISDSSILFIAQNRGPFYADELDAIWVALNRRLPTLNGYSGNLPQGYKFNFGNDCSEAQRRVEAYRAFQVKHQLNFTFEELKSRILLVGFENCK